MASGVCWVGFLVMARFRAPVQRRLAFRWIGIAGVLVESGIVLSMIASQRHWTLHHTALGVIGFLLPVGALASLARAAIAWRHRPDRRRA